MIEADRQYFEAMERLFAYPEMKVLLDDINGWKDAIASQWRTLKPDQLAFEQGRYDGLNQVTNHATFCENMKLRLLEQESEAHNADDV